MSDGASVHADVAAFGPFRLYAAERLLKKGETQLALSSRALDLLIALVRRAGDVVGKKDLIAEVWPGLTVEESNLRVHIAGLRKALGDGEDGVRYLTNVPGRGYCFVAPIVRAKAPKASVVEAPDKLYLVHNLPPRLSQMIGRDDVVQAISSQLARRRFVTITGPGGMGKTTVALHVAHAALADFEGSACFVDLGALGDPHLVPSALASALGLRVQTDDPTPALMAFLRDRRILLVLDSCERVVDAVSALAERIFHEASEAYILATSTEPLRVEGEHLHRLQPLESPPHDTELAATDILAYPAAQLFVERAAASGGQIALSEAEARRVSDICRKLDGIALAIEIVAGRVTAYGIEGTNDLLDNRFRLLWRGRRTALPRHQTLSAMLDWSYNLLSSDEQLALRRICGLTGAFTLDAAQAIGADADFDAARVVAAIDSLVAKSLISTVAGPGQHRFRLLNTTRDYALGKLEESGEADAIRQRHALHFTELLERSDPDRRAIPKIDASSRPAELLGNLRAALDWSFSSRGDLEVGVRLAAASAPVFLGMSLLGECGRWSERALAGLDNAGRGTLIELRLQEAMAISWMFTRGNGEDVRAAIARGLDLAESLGDHHHQLQMLAGLNIFLTRTGDFRGALDIAQRSEAVARKTKDPAAIVMAEWMVGVSHHLVGDQAAAQRHCEIGFTDAARSGRLNTSFFGYDHRVRALVALARALWLQGRLGQAIKVAHDAIDEADNLDHPVSVCISLIYTAPIFMWLGDWAAAEDVIERLISHADKYSLAPYHAVGLALKGEMLVSRGDIQVGLNGLRSALASLHAERHNILATGFAGVLSEGLARTGLLDEASATIDRTLAGAEHSGESFNLAELLRIKGQILARLPQADHAEVEILLLRSLDQARGQSAIVWELRSAMALAHLRSETGRRDAARKLLAEVYGRFDEGFEAFDLRTAKRLLADLA